MYIYTYISSYINMYICIYTHIHLCKYRCIRVYIYTHIYVCIHMCIYVYLYTHISIDIDTYIHVHVKFLRTCVWTFERFMSIICVWRLTLAYKNLSGKNIFSFVSYFIGCVVQYVSKCTNTARTQIGSCTHIPAVYWWFMYMRVLQIFVYVFGLNSNVFKGVFDSLTRL